MLIMLKCDTYVVIFINAFYSFDALFILYLTHQMHLFFSDEFILL